MRKILLGVIIYASTVHTATYITYGFSGGRLGDNLSSYIHAKWLAYKYGLTLLYKPFEYSEQLMLHDREVIYNSSKMLPHAALAQTPPLAGFQDEMVYVMPYGTECAKTIDKKALSPLEVPDWNDTAFVELLRTFIAPKPAVLTHIITPPTERISIAVHVRLGGGVDTLSTDPNPRVRLPHALCGDILLPGNHPPHAYFITCLRSAMGLYPKGSHFYIHLFTDHQQPLDVIQLYAYELNDFDIQWSYRTQHTGPTQNVLEDLFSMCNFKVLIMPASNFSWVASKIGRADIVVQPAHLTHIGGTDIIDEIEWVVHGTTYRTASGEAPSIMIDT